MGRKKSLEGIIAPFQKKTHFFKKSKSGKSVQVRWVISIMLYARGQSGREWECANY